MSDTILSGDFTVYYASDNNRKQIKWSGSATVPTYTVNQLYSALMDLFDELAQMDDGVPMSAQTPTEYTIGAIDASDTVPWFIDDETIQRLKGGAIKTSLWTRTASNPGIVKLKCSANASIVYGDIGNTITMGTSTGTLLDLQGSGASTVLWIRPADTTSNNNFSQTSTAISCNGHAATSAAADPVYTGEALWANIYSLGSISTDKNNNPTADLYVYKDGVKVQRLSSGASAYQWWPTGHTDILMKVKEAGAHVIPSANATISGTTTVTLTGAYDTTKMRVGQPVFGTGVAAGSTIASITGLKTFTLSAAGSNGASTIYVNTIDGSYVTVYAREYDTNYDYFTVDLNSGGRNPIPLATGDDLNNHTGTRTLTGSSGTNTFAVGEIIYVGASLAAATKKGVLTAVGGTGAAPILTYYLIGDLTDFANLDAIKGTSSPQPTCTAGAPSNNAAAGNPAGLSPAPTLAFAIGGYSINLNNGNGAKPYSIQVDCQSGTNHSLAKVYEWTKYVTRRGSATAMGSASNTVGGEQYMGIDYKLTVATTMPSFASGVVVFQASTGAYGTVVTCDTTNRFVMLRNTRGSFDTGTITDGTSTSVGTTTATPITPIKPNPYGTFAGGKFFAAPGVYFVNYAGADAQNFQLTANDLTTQVPPNLVSVTITGLVAGDGAGVFRTSGGSVVKNTYTVNAALSAGGTTVTANTINSDEPAAGFLRVVKVNGGGAGINYEHRYRYSSWSGAVFTLASVTTGQAGTITGNGSLGADGLVTVTVPAISLSEVFVGDMCYVGNIATPDTVLDYGTIVAITDTTHIKVRPNSKTATNWTTAQKISYNKLATSYSSGTDRIYVPIIDTQATGTTLSNTLIYSSDIPVLVRVRQYKNIVPFEQSTSVSGTGLSVSAIRSSDSIAS